MTLNKELFYDIEKTISLHMFVILTYILVHNYSVFTAVFVIVELYSVGSTEILSIFSKLQNNYFVVMGKKRSFLCQDHDHDQQER